MPTDTHTVTDRIELSRGAFILRFTKQQLVFNPGEHLLLGVEGDTEQREYSVYSSPHEDDVAVLVKEVENGSVSKQLHQIPIGASLTVHGPLGYFTIPPTQLEESHYLIATGTGIAPFHCFVTAYPDLNYTLLHGTRYLDEQYQPETYDATRLVHCCTREHGSSYRGRVTEYLKQHTIDVAAHYYLCGNCDMIYEVFDILQQAQVPTTHIFAEVYF